MRAWRLFCQLGILGGVVAAAIHCGSDNGSTFNNGTNTAACNTAYAGKCGTACTNDTSCATGLYCNSSKVCTADCAPSVACADGTTCNANGTCGVGTGNCGGFGCSDGGDTDVDGGTILPDGGFCASKDVQLTKTEPYVLFVLDQSYSMFYFKFATTDQNSDPTNNPSCTNGCRWTVLKDAIIGPNVTTGGIIKKLAGTAKMAVALYSATDSVSNDDDNSHLPTNPTPDLTCPRFNGKSFANAFAGGLQFSDDNAAAVDALLRPASVDDDTPTGYALQKLAGLNDAGAPIDPNGFASLDAGASPKVVVLVTDGVAGNCVTSQYSDNADTVGQQTAGQAKTLAVVKDLYKNSIRTFVIDIGVTALADQFKAIAQAGQGQDSNGTAAAIAPTNTTALSDALEKIVTDARSCTFALDGTVTAGQESRGTVLVNDVVAPFNTGWQLTTPSSITLLGDFCNTIKTDPNARLKATFPCGSITIGGPK